MPLWWKKTYGKAAGARHGERVLARLRASSAPAAHLQCACTPPTHSKPSRLPPAPTNGKFVKVAVELGVSPKNITAVCFTPFAFAYTNSVANGHWNSKSNNILLMTENDFLTELDKKSK
jgi:hypothetical protein